jgi:hypothetical protein
MVAFPRTSGEVIMFVVNECVGVPLCIAGGEAFVTGEYLRAAVGFGLGVPLCVLGFTFPSWRDRLSADTQTAIQQQAIRWAPLVILAAFAYVVGPNLYHRAIVHPFGDAAEVQRHTLIDWLQKAQQERDRAARQIAALQSRLGAALQERDAANSELTKLRQRSALPLAPTSPPTAKPRYESDEIDRMLKMLESLSDIVTGVCTDASNVASEIQQTWAGSVRSSGELLSLSSKFADARTKLTQCGSQITAVIVRNDHYYSEIGPTMGDYQRTIGTLDGILADIAADIRELSKANNINPERFLGSKGQKLQDDYIAFEEWVNYSRTKITGKTTELREWHNP